MSRPLDMSSVGRAGCHAGARDASVFRQNIPNKAGSIGGEADGNCAMACVLSRGLFLDQAMQLQSKLLKLGMRTPQNRKPIHRPS